MPDAKGVQFTPPPPGPIMEAALRVTMDAIDRLPADAKGGVFAVATTKGVNAVVVHRIDERFKVAGWIGKTWGQPLEAGASVVMTW